MESNDLIAALAKAMAPELAKTMGLKGATGTPTSYLMHGNGGLFATAGVDQAIISTAVRPTGLLEVLPAYATQFTNPLFTFITGFLSDTGSDPSGPCDNCVTAGVKKACTQTAQFGRYCRETKEIDVTRIGKLLNRSEPTDLRMVNSPFGGGNAL
ncbi:MAG: hypothetical protein Q8R28_11615, partial [Dehalococcoidia bacterium]|nr:hypothetical protein [Dehalococcoidia bacterium]